MNNSWTQLRDTLPIEVIARTMSYQIKQNDNYNCIDMMNIVYGDVDRANKTCTNHNMTDPNSIKFYINATWYGDSKYATAFQLKTLMTPK